MTNTQKKMLLLDLLEEITRSQDMCESCALELGIDTEEMIDVILYGQQILQEHVNND